MWWSVASYHVACVQFLRPLDQSHRRRTQQVSANANNVGLCCNRMLRPFDQGVTLPKADQQQRSRNPKHATSNPIREFFVASASARIMYETIVSYFVYYCNYFVYRMSIFKASCRFIVYRIQ